MTIPNLLRAGRLLGLSLLLSAGAAMAQDPAPAWLWPEQLASFRRAVAAVRGTD